ncbi:MAG TPA: 16S rRNA (guanine(966)-N(2))-methyltransferase RsmD [Bdellovibrionales bacterium]|nr:16S rRNA (guanine(966)-N(2))-methyltransferase RsmD [Bdellovibrionales bacterium]
MRIISGKYGGRKLTAFKADHIRPTSDRVKESLFNILMSRWDDARVLDLFSGTGNLGLEALSRGAKFVEAVEQHSRSIDIIRKNKELLGVGAEMKIVKNDVIKYLRNYSGEPYDVVLVDPPFTKAMSDEVLGALALSRVVGPQSIIAIESSSQETVKERYASLVCVDTRTFGDKILSFFRLE